MTPDSENGVQQLGLSLVGFLGLERAIFVVSLLSLDVTLAEIVQEPIRQEVTNRMNEEIRDCNPQLHQHRRLLCRIR